MNEHSGHYGDSGVQRHSAGPIFPYTIVVLDCLDGDEDRAECYALGLGNELPHHEFRWSRGNFGDAHLLAEQDALAALRPDTVKFLPYRLEAIRAMEAGARQALYGS